MDYSGPGGSESTQALAPPVFLLWSVAIWSAEAPSHYEGDPLILILSQRCLEFLFINININESQHSRACDLFVRKRWAPEQFPRIPPPPRFHRMGAFYLLN